MPLSKLNAERVYQRLYHGKRLVLSLLFLLIVIIRLRYQDAWEPCFVRADADVDFPVADQRLSDS